MTAEMGVALDLMRIEGICKMLIQSIDQCFWAGAC